jgi:Fe-S oxidoreductase
LPSDRAGNHGAAELLRDHTEGWQLPRVGGQAIARTHCHQHAIMGYDPDRALLADAGVELDVLDSGCCGLAGNFGFEAGHFDVSLACAERALPDLTVTPPSNLAWTCSGLSVCAGVAG